MGNKNFHHPGQSKLQPLLEYGEMPLGEKSIAQGSPNICLQSHV
jgi:hypothetical protein